MVQDVDNRFQKYLNDLAPYFPGVKHISLKKPITSGQSGSEVLLVTVEAQGVQHQKENLKKSMLKHLNDSSIREVAARFSDNSLTFPPHYTLKNGIDHLFELTTRDLDLYPKLVAAFLNVVPAHLDLQAESFLIGENGSYYLKIYTDTEELEGVKRLKREQAPLYQLMPKIWTYCVFQKKLHVLYEPASRSIHPNDVRNLSDLCHSSPLIARMHLNWLGNWMRDTYMTHVEHDDLQPHDVLKLILRPKRVEGPSNVQARAQSLFNGLLDTSALLNTRRIEVESADTILPNPLAYLEHPEWWNKDSIMNIHHPKGRSHGDLHSGNIVCRTQFKEGATNLEIIDFDNPGEDLQSIFFDFAYLEFDLIRRALTPRIAQNRNLILNFLHIIMYEPEIVPTEMRVVQEKIDMDGNGINLLEYIKPLRRAVYDLVKQGGFDPDYNNAFWLACVAVGLNFLRKEAVPYEERVFGFLYAAYALRCALGLHEINYKIGQSIFIPWLARPMHESDDDDDMQDTDEVEALTKIPRTSENDENVRRWRREYLLRLLDRVGKVNLTQILKNAPKEEVNLADVFIPLDTDVRAMIKVENAELSSWWLVRYDENESTGITRPLRYDQLLPEFELSADAKDPWLDYLKQQIAGPALVYETTRQRVNVDVLMAMGLVQNLVITGEPGSGKSTAVRYMAMCMAGQMLNLDDSAPSLKNLPFWPTNPRQPLTPIYIELRALVRSAFPNVRDPITRDSFMSFLRQQLEEQHVDNYAQILEEEMNDGKVIIFLDGLDEIPDADRQERQEQIVDLINLLRSQFSYCHIIVTSRTYAYRGQLDGFGHVHLTTLPEDKHMLLAKNLFTQILTDQPESVVREELQAFELAIRQVSPDLKSNPLFFSLIVAIWLNNFESADKTPLPVTISEMYRRSVEMMIHRWTSREIDSDPIAKQIGLNRDELQRLLEILAFNVHNETHEGDDALFESGRVLTIIRRDLGIKPSLDGRSVNYDQLIEALAKRAGIIHEVGDEMFQFTHRSFQEHLSASYLANNEYPVKAADCLRVNPSLWRNVMELFPAEVQDKDNDLWEFISELLKITPPATAEDLRWYNFYHAYRLMHQYNLPRDEEWRTLKRGIERAKLKRMISLEALTPPERAEMGKILAAFGDDREGVGLETNTGLPKLLLLPVEGGTFTMGNTIKRLGIDDDLRDSDTYVPDSVKQRVSRFEISCYPITFMQYEAFINDGGYTNAEYWLPEGWRYVNDTLRQQPPKTFENPHINIANHPVRGISWYEAHAFTVWLSKKMGKKISLPTETQWEWAARGTDERLHPYDGEYRSNRQNSAENQIRQVCSVGLFLSSAAPSGAQDMTGNIREWTLTEWRTDYNTPERNFAEDEVNRVTRGGSYNSAEPEVRVTARKSMNPLAISHDLLTVGFRVVCNVD